MEKSRYNFNYGWHFRLADAFPLRAAKEAVRDREGREFSDRAYQEEGWREVSLPHTYNDEDLFVNRIQDAGSGQKRTFSCYRKWFSLEEVFAEVGAVGGLRRGGKVFLELEGVRQTCYLYVNGELAGYYEAGAFPIGFDLTDYLTEDPWQLIAIATDSTSSRNLDFFGAETPNHPDAEPGAFYASLTKGDRIPEEARGVAYQWNCNDFNPTVGGIARNVFLHVKPAVYLTLPLYSNLKTKGVYVYADDFDIQKRRARVHVEAEIRNESGREQDVRLEAVLYDAAGRQAASFAGETKRVAAWKPGEREALADGPGKHPAPCGGTVEAGQTWDAGGTAEAGQTWDAGGAAEAGRTGDVSRASRTGGAFKTIIPEKAYRRTEKGFEPVGEEEAGEVETASFQVEVLEASAELSGLTFWDVDNPYLYHVKVTLYCGGEAVDTQELDTGFRKVTYEGGAGLKINDARVWLTGYAQRAANEWAALGCAPDWLRDMDAKLIRESNANHIRFMHVAGAPADVRSFDRFGIVCTQPAGDKERETFGRQWKQRVELMRDIIIYFRNSPSILFWEAGNNSINREHMREMRLLKEKLDPCGGRFMGCRTINTQDVIQEAEYAGTMLNRHAAPFIAGQVPITETEYLREEAPRRVWDDFTPPHYDYDNLWLGKAGRKLPGYDFYDLTSEDFALRAAGGYQEFFHDRVGGASGKNLYCAAAALCWTDSAQHGRQAHSENGRMSGRVDPVRVKKQNFRVFQVMQSPVPDVAVLGHWNYPPEGGDAYRYALKEFDGTAWVKTGEYARRNPRDKTVYVAGSYGIARVELDVNGVPAGSCEKPVHTFLFPIPHVDVTQSGKVCARAYDYEGNLVAEDCLETAGAPARLMLTAFTGEKGFLADGGDVMYIDVEVQDSEGHVCPLCADRIDFTVEGPAVFLGGYNSGRFRGPDRDDSVIHRQYVYAECGVNRVFLRSVGEPGEIRVTAVMEGKAAELLLEAVPARKDALSGEMPQRWSAPVREGRFDRKDAFPADPRADAAKYVKQEGVYCKVLVNGQEPNTNGILSKVDHGSIYSPILVILESLHRGWPDAFSYTYENKVLTLDSGAYHVEAEVGRTHMLVNGEENLLNGQPYENEDGVLILEINALVPYIQGVRAEYDEKANLFRIAI